MEFLKFLFKHKFFINRLFMDLGMKKEMWHLTVAYFVTVSQ